jgi:hypothetical protein
MVDWLTNSSQDQQMFAWEDEAVRDPFKSETRRRIERLQELRRLRELLDDPGFDDLD